MTDNWYSHVFNKLHFDMHTPAEVECLGAGFDGREFARRVKESGAEAVCYFAKSALGWSHYPTKVGLMHPHLQRDLLGEAVEGCRAEGIRFLAYYCIEILPPPLAEAHPEWLTRSADGNPCSGDGRYVCCMNTTARTELFLPQVEEVVGNYEVDGVFFDGYPAIHGVCHCEACRSSFGGPIPVDANSASWPEFLRWQRGWLRQWCKETGDLIHGIRPDAVMAVNYLAANRFAEAPPPGVDALTADFPVSDNCALGTSYQLSGWSWRDLPCDVMNARMLHWWGDWTTRPLASLETEYASAIARCARLFLGDLLPPDTSLPDPDVMVLARASFEFVDPRRSLAVETTPIADIAILNSETSHIARSRQPNINETPLRGAFVSLLEGGWTSHILLEEDLASELGKYQTLVLPEQPVLDSETISRVREFVRAGGGLVVVGEMESSGKEFPLGEVLGLHPATGWEDDRAYVVIPDEWADALWPNFEPVRPKVLVLGAPTVVQTVEANALCPLTRAGVPYQLGVRAPAEATTFPALTLNEFGKGRAAYAALPLCSDYWRRGNSGAKHLLNGLVALVTPRPTVRVESDCSLEVTLARRGEETVVHLIAYHSERRAETPPVVERIPKSRNVLVHLRRETAPSSVVQQPESRELEWSYRDEAVTFPVPDFRLHTAVVVR